jgi:hypothetical protein
LHVFFLVVQIELRKKERKKPLHIFSFFPCEKKFLVLVLFCFFILFVFLASWGLGGFGDDR